MVEFKNMIDRESRKIVTFVIRVNCLKNVWQNNTEALVTSKRLKFPQDDRTDTKFKEPLRTHF